LLRGGPLWRDGCAGSTVVSIFQPDIEKTPCLHEASEEQFGFPVHASPGRGSSSHLLEVKNEVLVALRVFSLKKSKAGAFAMPFRVLSRKKYDAGR